jgi:hypothetical protein
MRLEAKPRTEIRQSYKCLYRTHFLTTNILFRRLGRVRLGARSLAPQRVETVLFNGSVIGDKIDSA